MLLDTIRIAIMILISIIYAYFDVFNKRNIPNSFAYIGIVIAAILTLAYPQPTIIYGIVVAAIVAVIFYVFYRTGQVGAGDGFELVTISLLLPIQPTPILQSTQILMPFNSPFVLSVFIATGIVTLIGVPIYYLLISKNTGIKDVSKKPENARKNLIKATAILLAYLLLYFSLVQFFGPNLYGAVIILLMGIFSAITIMYSRKINSKMVSMKKASSLEEGDMIATNFISSKMLASLSKKYNGFGNLVTGKLAIQLKRSNVKLPVYQNSVPLSLSILAAVIISLLIGNLLFLVI